jgi:hypothetical protein
MKSPEYQENFRQRMAAFKRVAASKTSQSRLSCNNTIKIPIAIHFQGVSSNDRACLENLANQQITNLNADFQGSNPDIGNWTNNAASLFSGISNGETCVEFCIASRNHPNGYNLSDGQLAITINQTNGDRIDAWAGYLNIFVKDIGDNILGYSPLGGRGNGDGVVIAKFAFGGTGACGDVSTSASLDRGRTLTHEVGHWFLLDHIWGDGGCDVDDGVEDTPKSNGPNYGCPTLGKTACNSPDMHMNYMDYTNDECMYMFSAGQSTRMESYIQANLQSLMAKGSTACGAVTAPTCNDGLQNGDETGIDCGGSCSPCPTNPTCEDGVQNGDETGIDCGGSCSPCPTTPTCEDGIQNGDETGIDCGGSCSPCPDDNNCNQNMIYVLINPDDYGSETTWVINDEAGNEIASGGPYIDYNHTPDLTEVCLPDGCYDFFIFDAFGDGICCTFGEGQFSILDKDKNELISGGNFGAYQQISISAGENSCGEPESGNLCTPPSPTIIEFFGNLTRARVNWNPVPEANRYHLQYRIAGSETWTRLSTNRTRKTLRNLQLATAYELRFRARCPEGWTNYGPIYEFTTLGGRLNTDTENKLIESNLKEYEAVELHRFYPNPVRDQLNLDYTLDLNGKVEINVYDILGKKIIHKEINQEEGRQKVQLNTSIMSQGTFFLEIKAENQQIIRKFLKK